MACHVAGSRIVCAGPIISLAMGERGLPSRLLASRFGSHLTFACLGKGRASAPGQPSISDLRSMYRADQLEPTTRVSLFSPCHPTALP